MDRSITLLVLETRPDRVDQYIEALRRVGFDPSVCHVATESAYRAALLIPPDLILSGYDLPELATADALQHLQALSLNIPFIVVADEIGAEAAATCIRQGATDFLRFDHVERLGALAQRALAERVVREHARGAGFERLLSGSQAIFLSLCFVPSFRFTYISPSMSQILGYTPEALYADPDMALEMLHPDDRPLLAQMRENPPDSPYTFTLRWLREDGEIRWMEHHGVLICDDHGNPIGAEEVVWDITAHKHTEEMLRRREQQYRALFEQTNDAVCLFNLEGVHTAVNQQAADMFGYTVDELIGMSFRQLVSPNELHQSEWVLTELKATKTRLPIYERRFVRKDGTELLAEVNVMLVRDADGNPLHIQSILRDITARKQAEQALRESETQLRLLIEQIPAILWTLDTELRLISLTGSGVASLPVSPEALIGKKFPDVIPPYNPDFSPEVYQRVLRGESAAFESRMGERIYQTRIEPLHDAEGNITGCLGLELDITEHKRAEEALRQSEERFSRAFHASPIPILIMRLSDTYIVDANEKFLEMIGYTREELIGQQVNQLSTLSELNGYQQTLWELGNQGNMREVEVEVLTKAGDTRTALVSVETVVLDGEACALILVYDITRRKQIEKEALELALERERIQLVEGFVADASHDFRTPISVLKTSSYLLDKFTDQLFKQTIRLGGKVFTITPQELSAVIADIGEIAINIRKQVGSLANSSQRLENMVEGLLEITRLRNQASFEFAPRSLNVLVDSLIEMHRPLAAEKKLSLHLEVDHNIPFLLLDEAEFSRVVQNLLENALRYTPEGGFVIVRTYQEDREVVLSVSDTGTGIAPTDLPHIFKQFYRADRARSTHSGGVGLGLTIAKRIAEAHGGRIEVESVDGQGSMFRVCLPKTR